MFSPRRALSAPIRSLFIVLTLQGLAGPVQADDSALTLSAAVGKALARAPEVSAQIATLDAADALTISAGRLPDPELVLGIEDLPVSGADAYSLSRDSFTQRKVGLMQAFPSASKRDAEKTLARSEVAVAKVGLARTRTQIAQTVALAWIDRQQAEATLARLADLTSQLALQESLSRAALSGGRSSAADALGAQAARAQSTDRAIAARADVQRAVAALSRWLGADGANRLAEPPNFAVLPSGAANVLDSSHEHAIIAAIDAQIAAARAAVALAQSAKRPDWSAELSYGNRALFSDMVSLEFRVGLPIFAKNHQNPQILAKSAVLQQLESERDAALRMHRAELQSVLADWYSSRERLALLERDRLPLAQTRINFAASAYRSGNGPLRPVLDATADFIELQLSALTLKAQLGRAWATLAYQSAPEIAP